ncbi:TetR family transcriptional regulator [Nakamurella antarctica]|uniref:TetR family transcriptional regulator n=1 Tax=Nakamurella antarctica TaxID=1902245 RepID=UPI0013DE5669|nr:TetR family transcriptional regulator [Nakamurella antarctica]
MGNFAQWAMFSATLGIVFTDQPVRAHLADTKPFSGLRARKKDATRRELAEIAVKLTVQRGYDGFTIAELADAAGVSRRTFSNYFASKAECVAAIQDEQVDRTLSYMRLADPSIPLHEILRTLVSMIADDVTEEFGTFFQIASTEMEVKMQLMFQHDQIVISIAEVIAGRLGLASNDVVAHAIAGFSMTACQVSIDTWLAAGRPGGRPTLYASLERAFGILDLSALEVLRRTNPG